MRFFNLDFLKRFHRSRPGTNAQVAARDESLRDIVHAAYVMAGSHGATPDEISERIKVDVMTVRPRVTELTKQGRLARKGERRLTPNGGKAHVLIAA